MSKLINKSVGLFSLIAGMMSLIVIQSCQRGYEIKIDEIEQTIADYKKEEGIDGRLTFFNITPGLLNNSVLLSGEIDEEIDKSEILHLIGESYPDVKVVDSLRTCSEIETRLVNVSVCRVRSEPRHSAELVTEHLMGYPIRVYDTKGSWALTKGPDGYIGWVEQKSLAPHREDWNLENLGFVSVVETNCKSQGRIVSDLVYGNVVKINEQGRLETTISLPDGRIAEVGSSRLIPLSELIGQNVLKTSKYMDNAMALMGRPYLWGGTSTKGMDCSGFTRTALLSQGLIIGRDASLQVLQGEEIEVGEQFENLQLGDFLFFGKYREDGSQRITHVALHLGEGRFVHSSVLVRVESLNPDHSDYNEDRARTFMQARRLGDQPEDVIHMSQLF